MSRTQFKTYFAGIPLVRALTAYASAMVNPSERDAASVYGFEMNYESSSSPGRIRVALMSYAMDNREAKGTALYTRKLIERLVKDSTLDVTLVHYERTDDPLYANATEIIMPELQLPFATRFVRQLLFFYRYRKEPFDVVHWFQPRLYPFFWLVPARRIVVTFHGGGDVTSGDPFVFTRFMFNMIAKLFGSFIDAGIAVSSYAKDEIAQAYGFPKEKLHVIYNGGGEDFMPLSKEDARARLRDCLLPERYLLCISRLQHHKNLIMLIRAYSLARERGQVSDALVIVGMPAGEEKSVWAAATESKYAEDIHFKDYVAGAHLNALYAAATAFVFPSRNEGFGLPLIEAMASGTPVASSHATALPEVAGDAVLLFNPLDIEDMAEKMRIVVTDEAIRARLVVAGLTRAKMFSWDASVRETVRLYQQLV